MALTLSLSSLRKPEDMDTASIITRKETAMETIAVFPLKRSFRDMNAAAFILLSIAAALQLPDYYSLLLRKEHRVAFLDVKGIEE